MWRQRGAWLLATFGLVLAGLAACGGGGGVGIEGTGAEPPTYADGPISGFGSIIVNGVHFDDSTAKVEDSDGGQRTSTQLKLGMVVQVDAGAVATNTTTGVAQATALLIRLGSELVGPVQSVNAATGMLTVLGQQVRLSADTVFDDRLAGGVAAVTVGRMVEIYGLHDPSTQGLRATRIEPADSGATLRLRGTVAALDTAARTLRIGGATLLYAGVAAPGTLAVGQYQRVTLARQTDAQGRFTVLSFGAAPTPPQDRQQAEVKGVIDQFTTATSFRVNGLVVNAANAQFPDGTAGLGLGTRVEVKGAIVSGVVVATKVEIESDDEVRDREFELNGSITSVNTVNKTLVLRGEVVDWSSPTLEFKDGDVADLKAGAKVEIKGMLSTDGTLLKASKIKFDD